MFKKYSEDSVAELIKRRHQCNTQDILIITTKFKKKVFRNVLTEVGLLLCGKIPTFQEKDRLERIGRIYYKGLFILFYYQSERFLAKQIMLASRCKLKVGCLLDKTTRSLSPK